MHLQVRAEGRFDCYLQYFRKVYLNKGDLISEWLLEASREPFWTHLGALVGCPVALLERLAALQGSLGTLLGDPWGALVSLWCPVLSRRVNLGVSWGLILVAGRLLSVFWDLLCAVWDGPRHVLIAICSTFVWSTESA